LLSKNVALNLGYVCNKKQLPKENIFPLHRRKFDQSGRPAANRLDRCPADARI
jgi:hypothetical protein